MSNDTHVFENLEVTGALTVGGASVIPPGIVAQYAGVTPPAGWLLCDGSSLLRAGTYAALFAAIGVNWGAVDGTHFTLPDPRGRVPIGVGTGAGLTARALATNYGAEAVALAVGEMPSHAHPGSVAAVVTDPTHLHVVPNRTLLIGGGGSDTPAAGSAGSWQLNENTTAVATGITVAVTSVPAQGSGTGHANLQPSIGFNYIIKY